MDALPANDQQEFRSFIERIERLEEEKSAIAGDVKDIKADMKSKGYDIKAVNRILSERKKDRDEVRDLEAVIDVYRHALGMLDGTPLGDAVIHRIGKAA